MYKILVFSDTHGRYDSCIRTIKNAANVNLILHAGDCTDDAENLSYIFPDIPLEFVRGNNDFFSWERDEKLLHVCGKKIFLTHGHIYNVKHDLYALAKKAKEQGADISVFGHTHNPFMGEIFGISLLNPGSSGKNAKYGEIIIDNGSVSINLLDQK